MPLLDLWKSNPDAVSQFTIEQVLSAAGDGQLKDGSACSLELRRFLQEVPTAKLAQYLDHCLAPGFAKSGHVLQDLVNELGRRLDYRVENGLYQGKVNAIGFDGLWIAPDEHGLVIEVKTTDAYRINLDTLAGYRTALIGAGRLTGESSILVVVGRQDTGDIEAQVRGSRHAWDMRLISIDALVRLVTLKESAEEEETLTKIRSLLVPFEYTRVDNIIDVMFATAKDVEAGVEVEQEEPEVTTTGGGAPTQQHRHTPTQVLQALRGRIIAAMSKRLEVQLVAQRRALHRSADGKVRVACAVSRRYPDGGYWYSYHRAWEDFLAQAESAFFVLGCVGRDEAYAMPYDVIHKALDGLNIRVSEEGTRYWFLILGSDAAGNLTLGLPRRGEQLGLMPYAVPLPVQ